MTTGGGHLDTGALGKASGDLFLLAFAALAVGVLRSTFGGAGGESGACMSMGGVAIAALACVALITRSIRLRTSEA